MNCSITNMRAACLKRMRAIVIAVWTMLAAVTIFWECRDNLKLQEVAASIGSLPIAALEQEVARSNLNHIGIILTVWLFGIAGVIYMFRQIMRLTNELVDEQHNVDVLFEGSPMPQLLFDDQLNIIRFNEAQRRLCLDFDQLAGSRCGALFQCVNSAAGCGSATSCSACAIMSDLRRVSLHGGRASGEARIASEFQPGCLQDIYLLYSLSAIAFKGENRVVMSYVDITARKKDEQEHRLAYLVLGQANEGVFLINDQLRLIYVNDTSCRSLGYSREELLTMTMPDIDPDITPELAVMMNELFTAGTLAVLESRHLTKDGRLVPVEISASGFEHDGNTFTLCMTRDISERKRMEAVTKAHIRILETTQSMDLSLNDTLRRILDELESLTGSSIGFYHFLEEDQETLFMQGWSTNTVTTLCHAMGTELHYPLARAGVWADAVRKRRPVIHNDYASLSNRHGLPEGHAPVIRELVVPVFRDERIVAIIGLGNKPEEYNETDVQIVSLFGDIVWEIVTRKRMEEQLAVKEMDFRNLAEHSPDCINRYDTECRFVYVNPQWEKTMGIPAAAVLGKNSIDELESEDSRQYKKILRQVLETGQAAEYDLVLPDTGDGMRYHNIRLVAERSADGRISGVLAIGRDMTERKNFQRQLHKLAYSDPLTSLPNRTLFWDRLTLAVQDAARNNENLGVMIIDLDCFKEINDTLGHDAGDKLLKVVASRFSDTLRPQDTVARLGGDEFAILVSHVRHEVDLAIIARKLLATFREPVVVSGRELFVTASIGIASFPSDSRDTTGLLCYADVAMYHAKESGKNNFKFYSIALTHAATERMELENDLRKALLQGELEVYYQPKIHNIIGQVVGAEALLRWNHPVRGVVLPDKFIGIAEDTGLICDIGAWVLHSACIAAENWNRGALRPVKAAVNISARQLVAGDFSDKVRATLLTTGCRPEWLELEITESVLMSRRKEVVATLEELDSLGIDIAIDDFGTGFSSFSYLTEFPVSTIKIDKEFVKDITVDKRKLELIRAIVSMGSKLGIVVVAEGVASGEQAACLDGLGCHIFQGYYFGRPMSLAGFDDWWGAFSAARPDESDGNSPALILAGQDEYLDGQRCCNE